MRTSSLGLYALAPLAVACSAPLAGPGASGASGDAFLADAAEGAASAGLIVFERTVSADESTHGSAVARFLRMRNGSVDEQALRMVGATLELPATGTCAAAASTRTDPTGALSVDEADEPRAVELLDVGAVTVEASGTLVTLEGRSLPDIVDLVTGVLYSTRTSSGAPAAATGRPGATDGELQAPAAAPPGLAGLPATGTYVFQSTGSASTADADHSVPAFTVTAAAPGEPGELRVDGQDARSNDGVQLTVGARADLVWSVGDANNPDDVVYVELVPAVASTGAAAGAEPVATVRCTFADHGAASIPASAFALGHGEMTRGTLVVHRVHRELFHVAGRPATEQTPGHVGIDSGVVRFDFARAAEFTRR